MVHVQILSETEMAVGKDRKRKKLIWQYRKHKGLAKKKLISKFQKRLFSKTVSLWISFHLWFYCLLFPCRLNCFAIKCKNHNHITINSNYLQHTVVKFVSLIFLGNWGNYLSYNVITFLSKFRNNRWSQWPDPYLDFEYEVLLDLYLSVSHQAFVLILKNLWRVNMSKVFEKDNRKSIGVYG